MAGLLEIAFSPSKRRLSRDDSSPTTPPPPYKTDGSGYVAQTTTTTVTTTTTTTQFFPWRRRPPTETTPRPSISIEPEPEAVAIVSAEPEKNISANRPLRLDKDLPPPPPITRPSSPNPPINTTPSGPLLPRAQSRPPSRGTAALAHAGLGLGLSAVPYASPPLRTAASPPAPQSSCVSFADTPRPSSVAGAFPHPPEPTSSPSRGFLSLSIRRAKSFSREPSSSAPPSNKASTAPSSREKRRTRGLSMGPGFGLSSDWDGKGKGKAPEGKAENTSLEPSKSISRRPSFWTRKRVDSERSPNDIAPSVAVGGTIVASPQSQARPPTLPSLPLPPSPLSMETFSQSATSVASPSPSSLAFPSSDSRRSESSTRTLNRDQTRWPGSLQVRGSNSRSYDSSPVNSPTNVPLPEPAQATSSSSLWRSRSLSLFQKPFPGPQDASSSVPALPSPRERPPLDPQDGLLTPPHLHTPPDSSASTSRRPRSSTNPPLLRRLSSTFFNTVSSSATPSSSSASASASRTFTSSPRTPTPAISPRPSSSSGPSRPWTPPSSQPPQIPTPRTDQESPEVWLERLLRVVSKAEVAGVLASSGDAFHAQALRAYLSRFDFRSDPLDVALRKLLMDLGLPRETQQIDRVMEAFAGRYTECNPGLFASDDQPYVLAFSLMMLHTDAFNKSNKNKMTKADYIKNTRLPGVAPEILDYFFDNIVFAPFIFIEDPMDVNGQRGYVSDNANGVHSSIAGHPNSSASTSSSLLPRSNRIDPYYLITRNLLGPMRIEVDAHIPPDTPYLHVGTSGPWDEDELQRAFARADIIEIGEKDARRRSTMPLPFIGGFSGNVAPPILSPGGMNSIDGNEEVLALKITKIGVLNRKEDILEGGKKASNRKWKPWSVLLTGSQLLFFRDPNYAQGLVAQAGAEGGHILLPQVTTFKPDELLSVHDSIALFDKTYMRKPDTFRFVMPKGRQFLIQASSEKEMNEWIARLNYASAFKTAGVRMRALGMSRQDIVMTGVAAANSHLNDIRQEKFASSPAIHTWYATSPRNSTDEEPSASSTPSSAAFPRKPHRKTLNGLPDRFDLEVASPIIQPEGAHQFKQTFDEIKAELAAGLNGHEFGVLHTRTKRAHTLGVAIPSTMGNTTVDSPISTMSEDSSRFSSRSDVIRSKIRDLESKITTAQLHLDADLRIARNLAVLTPFQQSTRNRMQNAVPAIAKRVQLVRMDLAKLICHRDVLSADLVAEEREWQRTRREALQAATDTLNSQRAVPRMTLSFHLDSSQGDQEDVDAHMPVAGSNALAPGSSASSFHSAQDLGADCGGSYTDDVIYTPSSFKTAPQSASPSLQPMQEVGGTVSYPFPDQLSQPATVPSSERRSSASSCDGNPSQAATPAEEDGPHRKSIQEEREEAEDWDKTRAAKRVSLVRVPSDALRLAAMGNRERQVRGADENTLLELDETLDPLCIKHSDRRVVSDGGQTIVATPNDV